MPIASIQQKAQIPKEKGLLHSVSTKLAYGRYLQLPKTKETKVQQEKKSKIML